MLGPHLDLAIARELALVLPIAVLLLAPVVVAVVGLIGRVPKRREARQP